MHNPKIFILDNIDPESAAMLQAYYSRSQKSIADRAEELGLDLSPEYKPSKIKDALREYYINYGHGSIGKQGVTYIFFEGVSMLFAKALQQHPQYAGQETSTRYIDFTQQEPELPLELHLQDAESATYEYVQAHERACQQYLNAVKSQLNFVTNSKAELIEHLRTEFPYDPECGIDEKTYERSLNARSFDILRGFLPIGIKTNVSWTTSLQNARDHLRALLTHNLAEVRNNAATCLKMMHERYPSAFKLEDHLGTNERINWYTTYPQTISLQPALFVDEFSMVVTPGQVGLTQDLKGTELPVSPEQLLSRRYGPHYDQWAFTVNLFANIDFGSYRDIQRHQRGYCSMGRVEMAGHAHHHYCNFHPWYYDQLPDSLQQRALELLDAVKTTYIALSRKFQKDELQYMCPMGTVVPLHLSYSLAQAKYVAELRSKPTVHPTLRPIVQFMGRELNEQFGPRINVDETPDGLSLIRGTQTIVIRGTNEQIAQSTKEGLPHKGSPFAYVPFIST